MLTHVFVMKSHKGLQFATQRDYARLPMFTCEKCHREKPEHECVRLHRSVSFVIGIMVPPAATLVCRRCSQRVKRLGLVAIAGLVAVTVFMVVLLDIASDFF
jgi:hypothetical protein